MATLVSKVPGQQKPKLRPWFLHGWSGAVVGTDAALPLSSNAYIASVAMCVEDCML